MIVAAPNYKMNIEQQLGRVLATFGMTAIPDFTTLSKDFNLANAISPILNGVRNLAQNALLVLIYVVFMLFEQKFFAKTY